MIAQSTFTEYLTTPPKCQEITFSYIGSFGTDIKVWVNSLTTLTELEQCTQIETTLSELILAQLEDNQRLKLMKVMFVAIERLTAQMRKAYKYEIGQLKPIQLKQIEHVKSLYYMSILVFNGVIARLQETPAPQNAIEEASWRRLIPRTKVPPNCLAIAVYWSMSCYQKLLFEFAIAYQKPPEVIWQQLNRLYLLTIKADIANVDVSRQILSKDANTVHLLYCQICLQGLMNLATFRRQDIVGIIRTLPQWAKHISATLFPKTKTRVFVNLGSDTGPEYLTPYTSINPYDDQYTCLFIELSSLLNYLESRDQSQPIEIEQGDALVERRLIDKTLSTLKYQFLNRQRRMAPRFRVKRTATLLIGFNRIHYHIAGKISFGNLIHQQELLDIYLPKNIAKPQAADTMIEVAILDQSVTGYRFRAEQTVKVLANDQAQEEEALPHVLKLTDGPNSDWLSEATNLGEQAIDTKRFAPPVLQVMSLFAMRSEDEGCDDWWELGIIRWIETAKGRMEAGGKLLGLTATACGIRLENNDGRSQDFVAAILIAGSESLKTKSSLIMARYHFMEGDQVVLRVENKQTQLILQRSMLKTDDIDQYEVAKVIG